MKILRIGWVKGAWQHRSSVPRLVFQVRGWPWLLADCLGLRRHALPAAHEKRGWLRITPGNIRLVDILGNIRFWNLPTGSR